MAHLKREISEKKWSQVRRWGRGPDCSEEVQDARRAASEESGGWVFEAAGRPTSSAGNRALSHRRYLHWTKNRPTDKCWWWQYRTQTRKHLFKCCWHGKHQQKILWVEVRKQTGRSKYRLKMRDLCADGRCSQPSSDFLSTTDVGQRVGLDRVEEDAQCEGSEWELREREGKARERSQEAKEL